LVFFYPALSERHPAIVNNSINYLGTLEESSYLESNPVIFPVRNNAYLKKIASYKMQEKLAPEIDVKDAIALLSASISLNVTNLSLDELPKTRNITEISFDYRLLPNGKAIAPSPRILPLNMYELIKSLRETRCRLH